MRFPAQTIRSAFASLSCLAVLASSAQLFASEPFLPPATMEDAPVSNLVVLSGSNLSVDWYGSGPVEISSPLCIGTSTGTYRLSILPSSGLARLARLASDTSLEFALEQDGVIQSSKPFDGQQDLVFTGRANPADLDCSGGENARLIVRISEPSLTSASAGQYFDQLRLHLEAI